MDQFFNHDVAEWIGKSVSRMDDAEAEMFTLFTVYEVHKADIENNRRTLNRHIEDVQKSILDDLHPEVREMVSKALDKDIPYDARWGRPQPRDQGGKFTRIVIERGKANKPTKPPNYREDKISVRTRGMAERNQDFDLSGALSTAEKEGTTFSQRWTARGDYDHSTNERTYRRVQAGAQLLSNVPNKNVQAAAALADFAGQMGPEAEKVIGPAARRTAYRYRGTEREADAELYERHDTVLQHMAQRDKLRSSQITPEYRMRAAELSAAGYLQHRLPTQSLSALHRESGKLPPSEGVIINASGDIVTQAVGYNEDHYLPFNLKNLKGLKGGSYVRTRSAGGLTSEDIYTGLIAGARSVTVVSRSGVFTLDFEDDLRGGRRYSDKARQMVGRYAQVLDAVQSQKVARRGLDPNERAEIREEVEGEMKGLGYKTAQIEAEIKNREKEFQSGGFKLTRSELSEIDNKAVELAQDFDSIQNRRQDPQDRLPDDPKRRILYWRSKLMEQAEERKASRMYQLDAEGYHSAMQALEEQFPYYVADVSFRPLPDRDVSTEKDSGYVRPNYNRPQAVRAGYYDEDINGKGKFSAADMHYQNNRNTHGRSTATDGEGEQAGAPAKVKAVRVNFNEARAQQKVQERRNAAVATAADAAKAFADPKDHPALTRYRSNPDITLFSEKDVNALVEDLKNIKEELLLPENRKKFPAASATFEEAMTTVDRASQQMASRVAFSVESWNPKVVSPYPQRFSDDPWHSIGSEDPALYQQHFAQVVNTVKLADEVRPDMTDQQLRAVQKKYSDIYAAATELTQDPENAGALNELANAMIRAGADRQQIEGLEDRFDKVGLPEIKPIAETSKDKALAVIQARSIVAASEGRMGHVSAGAGLEGAAANATVPSSVVDRTKKPAEPKAPKKPVPMRPLPDVLEDLVESGHYTTADSLHVRDLAIALRASDDEGVEDLLDTMGTHLSTALRKAVHEFQQQRDLG